MKKNNRPKSVAIVDYPCKGYEDRSVGCHSSCPKYLAAKDKDTELRQKIKAAALADDDYDDYLFNRIDKIRRCLQRD